VAKFKYLGTGLTNQNYINDEIKVSQLRECLVPFGPESFVIMFALQKYRQ